MHHQATHMRAVNRLISPPAGMFYCLTAFGLHEALGSPGGLPALAGIMAALLFLSTLTIWMLKDAQSRQRHLPYDIGFFVFMAAPVVLPIYIFSTRGWRGFAVLGWFLFLYVMAASVSLVVAWQHLGL